MKVRVIELQSVKLIIIFIKIIFMRIISRKIDVERIERGGPWVLVYGRRRTGKTFLVSNFLSFDRFFFVNRDSTVRDVRSMELYSFEEFLKVFREILGREREAGEG